MHTFTSGTNENTSGKLNDNFTELTNNVNNFNQVIRILASDTTYTTPGNDLKVMLSSMVAVAYDSANTNILKTFNAGSTWSIVKTGISSLSGFYVNSRDPNYLIAESTTTANTSYFSTDAGDNWTAITAPSTAGTYISYSITDTGRLYCVHNSSGAVVIAYSDNNGSTWSVVSGNAVADCGGNYFEVSTPINDVIAYVGRGTDLIYGFTIDGGTTWTENNPSSSNITIICALYLNSDNYLFDFYSDSGTNAGMHFVKWGSETLSSSSTIRYGTHAPATSYRALKKFDQNSIYTTRIFTASGVWYYWGEVFISNSTIIHMVPNFFNYDDYVGRRQFQGVSLISSENRVFDVNWTTGTKIERYSKQHTLYSSI
jgi:hypothetical protein